MRRAVRRVAVLLVLVASVLVDASPADAAGAFVYVRSAKKTVPVGDNRVTQKVLCPSGTRAVSGGVQVITVSSPGNWALVASEPYNAPGGGSAPKDGWRGVVNNKSDTDAHQMRTSVVCAKSGKYAYLSVGPTDAPTGIRTQNFVNCAADADKVVGGGVSATGEDGSIELSVSDPLDAADGDVDKDDGWLGGVNNDSGATIQLTVWVICALEPPPGTLYYTANNGTSSGGSFGISTVCDQPGHKMIAGGLFTGGFDPDVFLSMMTPLDSSADKNKRPDDSWFLGGFNASMSSETFAWSKICYIP